LLAIIIEKVSGKSYEQFLYENLWKPSNMESTGYKRPGFDNELIATGYKDGSCNRKDV
jgi:CubicO group peptidase (beta-lactamase class C family)